MNRYLGTFQKDKSSLLLLLLALSLSIISSYCLLRATTWGIGLTTDSLAYIEGAKSIAKDHNMSAISTHYPPLYHLVLAIFSVFSSNILLSTKWLHIMFIFVHSGLFGYVIFRETGRDLFWAVLGVLLFTSSATVLQIHAVVWSESLFCLLSLLGFFFLSKHLQKQEEIKWLLFSSILIALAIITRYVGATLIVAGTVSILVFSRRNLIKRLVHCGLFISISSSLIVIWCLRNLAVSSEATGREFIYHPISIAKIKIGTKIMLAWLHLPVVAPSLLVVVGLLIALFYSMVIKDDRNHVASILEIGLIFIPVYIVFLIFSISFFDSLTPLDGRILYPVYEFGLLSIVILVHKLSRLQWHNVILKSLLVVGIVAISTIQFYAQNRIVTRLEKEGAGFAHKSWVQSKSLKYLDKLPAKTLIYTNGPDPIHLYLDRASIMIPKIVEPVTRQRNPKIMEELKEMMTRLSEENGVLAYFNDITWRWYLPKTEQLQKFIPLEQVYSGPDGVIFRVNKLASQN